MKGVSEVLGYIMVLLIVVTSITIIYALGIPALNAQQNLAIFRSMECSFYVLQDELNLVAYNITPERSFSMSVDRGTIVVCPKFGTMNIVVLNENHHNVFDLSQALGHPYEFGAIVYCTGNRKGIILTNGAMMECFGDRCLMVTCPRFVSSGKLNVFLSLINVSGSFSFTGKHTIVLRNLRDKTLQFNAKGRTIVIVNVRVQADEFGFDSKSIEKEFLNYINESIFKSEAYLINDTTLEAFVGDWHHMTRFLNASGLNMIIGYHEVVVSR